MLTRPGTLQDIPHLQLSRIPPGKYLKMPPARSAFFIQSTATFHVSKSMYKEILQQFNVGLFDENCRIYIDLWWIHIYIYTHNIYIWVHCQLYCIHNSIYIDIYLSVIQKLTFFLVMTWVPYPNPIIWCRCESSLWHHWHWPGEPIQNIVIFLWLKQCHKLNRPPVISIFIFF